MIPATKLADENLINPVTKLADKNLVNLTIDLANEILLNSATNLVDDSETSIRAINTMVNPSINIVKGHVGIQKVLIEDQDS